VTTIGLQPSTTYSFALFSVDATGNVSGRTVAHGQPGAVPEPSEVAPPVGPGTPAGADPRTRSQRLVSRIYGDLFGRAQDPGGLATWSQQLDAGST
jgi:hypothetical protein